MNGRVLFVLIFCSAAVSIGAERLGSMGAATGSIAGRVFVDGRSDHGGVHVWVDLMHVAMTNGNGEYVIGGLDDGEYIVKAWSEHCLARNVDTVLVAGEAVGASDGVLRPIDVVADGSINALDAALIAGCDGADPGAENWDPILDLDGSGVIDSLDIDVLMKHWLESADLQPPSFEIAVTEPRAGSVWTVGGERVAIYWFTGNLGGTVSVELLRGGAVVASIAAATPNDGEYSEYLVPAGTPPGVDYSIRVRYDDIRVSQSDNFTIRQEIVVSEPGSGTVWIGGRDDVPIRWEPGGFADNVDIALFIGSEYECSIAASTPNDGAYDDFDVPRLSPYYNYRVRVSCGEARYGFSSDFSVTYSSTDVIVSRPNADESWRTGKSGAIVLWSRGTNLNATASILLFKSDVLVDTIAAAAPNTGSFSYTPPMELIPGDDYRVRVSIPPQSDMSEAFAIVEPCTTVTVLYPKAQQVYSPGGSMYIYLEDCDIGAPVSLALYRGDDRIRSISTTSNEFYYYRLPAELPSGSDYRVLAFVNEDNFDFSDYFEIRHRITVVEPAPGTVWKCGRQNVPVAWQAGDLSGEVSIKLLRGAGVVATIAEYEPNDGLNDTYDIPWFLDPGDNYYIEIRHAYAADIGGPVTVAPWEISVMEPNRSSRWWAGRMKAPIRWLSEYPREEVDIILYKGEEWVSTIVRETSNDGAYDEYAVPVNGLPPGKDYRILVRYDYRHFAFGEYFEILPFKIVPSIVVTSPSEGAVLRRGETYPILWETGGLYGDVSIDLYVDVNLLSTISNATPNDGRYERFVVPRDAVPGTGYRILVRYDSDRYDYSDYFTIQ